MRPNPPHLVIAAALLLAAAASAQAAEQRTTAMLWGSALEGTLVIGGATAEFDLSLQDIFAVLDGSFAVRHESTGDGFGWYGEFIYNDLKKPTTGALGERQANLEQTILELGLSQPFAAGWRVYGGLRLESVENSIDFVVAPSVSAGNDWTDLVFGVRWDLETDGGRWWARGDYAGGGSDGAFLVEGGVAWTFEERWEVSLAYRRLSTAFEEGAVLLDLDQNGTVIGVGYAW